MTSDMTQSSRRPGIHEFNIGHVIVARELFVGGKGAVVEM
jgi:pyridoxine 5'-phosphate synthase PdxJ